VPTKRHTSATYTERIKARHEAGREARHRAPRRALGEWDRAARSIDALEALEAQNTIRAADLLPIRYGRMSQSPWTYYRGAAAVMAADLATRPHSGLDVQLCGDAHILNFGLWATPERHLAFDLRDFDETLPGPFEWDVLRLAASIVVLARADGLPEATAQHAVRAAVDAYRDRMALYAAEGTLEIWYDRIDAEQLVAHFGDTARRQVVAAIEKGTRHRTQHAAFEKLVTETGDGYRIVENPPKLTHFDIPGVMDAVTEVFALYSETLQDDRRHCLEQFEVCDVARQVVGVGSVGMRVHLLLLMGRNGRDPLFLQVKQAGPSVYEAHLGPSRYDNHGARVVHGMRLIQSATDMFVGWTRFRDHDYYVRQFRDMKIIADSARIAPVVADFATACGDALAKSHARSGDPVAISGYIGRSSAFTDAAAEFAEGYADQTEADHAQLLDAIAHGTVTADADA